MGSSVVLTEDETTGRHCMRQFHYHRSRVSIKLELFTVTEVAGEGTKLPVSVAAEVYIISYSILSSRPI